MRDCSRGLIQLPVSNQSRGNLHTINPGSLTIRGCAFEPEPQRIARVGNWDWHIESDELNWSDEVYRIFGVL